jgi:hypothetical protein
MKKIYLQQLWRIGWCITLMNNQKKENEAKTAIVAEKTRVSVKIDR